MNPSINPITFQTMKIGTMQEQQQFLFKLSQLLGQIVSTVSGIQAQDIPLITPFTSNIGAIGATRNINCKGSLFVAIGITFSGNPTVILNNP